MDLFLEERNLIQQLDLCLKQLAVSGKKLAEAERDYKILLRTECLRLRDEGMAIGLIDKICYGIPSVAEARFKRDCAESINYANREAVNTIKLKLRLIDEQISREWTSANKVNS